MMKNKNADPVIHLPRPHTQQRGFIDHPAKRRIIRAGRRWGKTVSAGILAIECFLRGSRILYAAPTSDQLQRFWVTVTRALQEPVQRKVYYKNETEHIIEITGTENRIKAKTAWNADSLRGDYADVLILDEFQLMNEDTWSVVGAPMLLDNNGDAVFIYTPPSLASRSASKANDPQHAAKLFAKYKAYQAQGNKRFAAFHFGSIDNPHISKRALAEITQDMTSLSYRMEIMAEDVNEAPGALWTRKTLDDNRVDSCPDLDRIVVALDPSATSEGDEAGIVAAGNVKATQQSYVLEDWSMQGSPLAWAGAAVRLYHDLQADCIVAESNQGGEMVSTVISQVDSSVPVRLVHASRGKATRAEPIAAQYEQGRWHHVGKFEALEDEQCLAGDTQITTDIGCIPISDIQVGHRVLTRQGFKKVLWAGMTCSSSKVLKIKTNKGRHLLTTGNHPVYLIGKGFVKARDLKPNDMLEDLPWHTHHLSNTNTGNQSSIKARGGLSTIGVTTWTGRGNCSIGLSGPNTMAQSQRAGLSIIKMAIGLILFQKISNWYHHRTIAPVVTQDIGLQKQKEKEYQIISRPDGIKQNHIRSSALGAERNLNLRECEQCSVKAHAAGDIIQSIDIINEPMPVYNLTVEDVPEFYANGILVHNCLWMPGNPSPNRMDALVWAGTELMAGSGGYFDSCNME